MSDTADELLAAHAYLLAQAVRLPDAQWAEQPTPSYSPVGWHVGHAAATCQRWLLPGEPEQPFFDPFRTEKSQRTRLPEPEQLRTSLLEVGARAAQAIRAGTAPEHPGTAPGFLVRHLIQHALQHGEHVATVAALCEGRLGAAAPGAPESIRGRTRVEHPGGLVEIGCPDAAEAYDNERPCVTAKLAPFWVSATLVSGDEYAEFIAAGGYRDERFWSREGWAACQAGRWGAPFQWAGPSRCPVVGVSWYEAEAYARFRGARLPTEWEREAVSARAAAGNIDGVRGGLWPVDALEPAPNGLRDAWGNAWEWCSTPFGPYDGFKPYPYDGYSVPWFGTHRTLRGGGWATSARLCRPSFRNWYEPAFRELPAGIRLAGGIA